MKITITKLKEPPNIYRLWIEIPVPKSEIKLDSKDIWFESPMKRVTVIDFFEDIKNEEKLVELNNSMIFSYFLFSYIAEQIYNNNKVFDVEEALRCVSLKLLKTDDSEIVKEDVWKLNSEMFEIEPEILEKTQYGRNLRKEAFELFPDCREFTPEEREQYKKGILKAYKKTGRNINDCYKEET